MRQLHEWNVTLNSEVNGEVLEERVRAYWDPDFEEINESVGQAARCQAWRRFTRETGQKLERAPFAVLAVARIS